MLFPFSSSKPLRPSLAVWCRHTVTFCPVLKRFNRPANRLLSTDKKLLSIAGPLSLVLYWSVHLGLKMLLEHNCFKPCE